MQTDLQVVFHNLDHSDAIEASVREHAGKLERFYDKITSCRVTIEAPHHSQNKGNTYEVRIDINVPGKEIIVDRDPGRKETHRDVYVAVRDAFRAARRQLEDYVRERRGRVKQHEETVSRGVVGALFPYEGYGFVKDPSGREIYFHENAVSQGKFEDLEEGTTVRFVEAEPGDKGPQASVIMPEG